jgi:hypothetical protein
MFRQQSAGHRTKGLFFAILAVLWVLVPTASHSKEPASPQSQHSFIRITRDANGQPESFDTAIAQYAAERGPFSGAKVDLVAAIHVGEKSYYQQLNTIFSKYDAVLYELIAPEGTRIPKNNHLETGNQPIMMLQSGVQSMLGLEHQLESIDYTKANFVHADMSPTEFAKSMKDHNESFMQLFFRIMGNALAGQAQSPRYSDAELLAAMFAADRALRLKRLMAEQFGDLQLLTTALEGENGSTIITERNKKALQVLARELRAGKKRIAIFYGAGHLPDMEMRLLHEFKMHRTGVSWLKAWQLASEPQAPDATVK